MSKLRTILVVALAVIVPVVGLAFLGRILMRRSARAMGRAALASAGTATAVVTEADIARLPEPVRRWMRWSGMVGRPRMRTVRLRQKGRMRTGAGKPWMAFEAEQYFTTDPPTFVWYADVPMIGLPFMQGRDCFVGDRGNMLIKAGGWVTVVDERDAAIDQGSLTRYLSEIIWFPGAALEPYIAWTPIDERSARAAITRGDLTATATFFFNPDGSPATLAADRYYTGEGAPRLERWETPNTRYGEFGGVRMPVHGEAVWKLAAGDLPYIRIDITDVEYNVAATY
jgi:hypothetical protein